MWWLLKLWLVVMALLLILVPAARGEEWHMRSVCGVRSHHIAPLVLHYAREWGLDPSLLGAVVAAESTCDPKAETPAGDIGLGQIRVGGSAAHGRSRRQLLRPRVNLMLTARHLRWCLDLCDSYLLGALSVYRGIKTCRDSKGSHKVLQLKDQIERENT